MGKTKKWFEAVNWTNRGVKGRPFAVLGCPCHGYSHYCSLAEERALREKLGQALWDAIVNPETFDFDRALDALAAWERAQNAETEAAV